MSLEDLFADSGRGFGSVDAAHDGQGQSFPPNELGMSHGEGHSYGREFMDGSGYGDGSGDGLGDGHGVDHRRPPPPDLWEDARRSLIAEDIAKIPTALRSLTNDPSAGPVLRDYALQHNLRTLSSSLSE